MLDEPILLWYDIILTNYFCNKPIIRDNKPPNKATFWGIRVENSNKWIGGNTIQPMVMGKFFWEFSSFSKFSGKITANTHFPKHF
jgi:hypothetical protein